MVVVLGGIEAASGFDVVCSTHHPSTAMQNHKVPVIRTLILKRDPFIP
jgi:hypothetical protein